MTSKPMTRPDARQAAQPSSFRTEAVATVRAVGLALLFALTLRVFIYQPFTIPSASMEPGLVEGDYVLVSKFSYGWSRASFPWSPPLFSGRVLGREPERGDVVVFKAVEGGHPVIKRVVGLPGDRVRLSGGAVFVNGRALPRRSLGMRDGALAIQELQASGRVYRTLDRGSGREGDDTGVYRVPAGRYFVLGDNRDNSLDSRWPPGWGQGFVPAENLVGEAQLILLSWEPGASLFKPWTWLRLRDERAFRRL